MLHINTLATWVPSARLSAEDIIIQTGYSPREAHTFCQLYGFRRIAALEASVSLYGVFYQLISQLMQQSSGPDVPIDALIYVHGMPKPHGEQPAWLARLKQSHPFVSDTARCYELDQQHCATLFWALARAHRLLEDKQAKRVAIIAGDTLSPLGASRRYVPGYTLMGDAFAALLLEREGAGLRLGKPFLGQRLSFDDGLNSGREAKTAFYQAHDDMVREALAGAQAGDPDSLSLLPHNINRLSWRRFVRRYPLPREAVSLGLLPDIGHCCAVDPLLLLPAAMPAIRNGQPHVMLSIGLGAAYGSCSVYFRAQ
ncbi:3-oxoacyl-ACP synthase [Lonsdalea quercina]|uniref:3-oxoacyl-ACP synthase n=1 Tax=Lonsdalea quercina TaxID=71657 RepID=UPI00397681A9